MAHFDSCSEDARAAAPPVVAFDGDQPGRESNVRLATAAASRHREVVITNLPDGHDPTSWLAEHGDAGLAA